jgi:hypothetical protein
VNFLPPKGVAVLSAGWSLDGFGPYVKTLLEWTVEFRFGLGVCKAVSYKTEFALSGNTNERPCAPDAELEITYTTLLGTGRAWIERNAIGSGTTIRTPRGQYLGKAYREEVVN